MADPIRFQTPARQLGKPDTPTTIGKYHEDGTADRYASLVKIAPARAKEALERIREDGIDNVAFKLGDDLYIASGRNMCAGVVAPRADTRVMFRGQAGALVAFDNQDDVRSRPDGLPRRILRTAATGTGAGVLAGLLGGMMFMGVGSSLAAFGTGFALFGLAGALLVGALNFPSRPYLTTDHEASALRAIATLGA